jgi:uncharacterized protein (TIGR02217 family)
MSEPVFPTLPGKMWPMVKTPIWSTAVQRSANGREVRSSLYANPLWKFSLSYEFLRSDATQELQQMLSLFNLSRGQFGTFLFLDPTDSAVTDQLFGTGNGSQIVFPLTHAIGTFVEPVAAVVGSPVFKANGSVVSATVANGVVTFASPPTGALTWTGQFYYRCRFLNDDLDFANFMQGFWEAKKVEFRSTR